MIKRGPLPGTLDLLILKAVSLGPARLWSAAAGTTDYGAGAGYRAGRIVPGAVPVGA